MDSIQIAAQNILSDRRGKSELERDRRVEEFHRKYPRLAELDREIKVCRAEMLLEMAVNRGAPPDRSGLDAMEKEKREYLAQSGITPDYARVIPFCGKCDDTGFKDGEPCICYRELILPGLVKESGLDRYPNARFSVYKDDYYSIPEKIRMIRTAVEAYVRGFPAQSDNLLFWGDPGTGKTFMAACLAREVVNRYVPVLMLTVSSLLDIMNSYRTLTLSFSPDEERLTMVRAQRELIFHGGLLVIDELGVEAPGPNTVPDLLQILGTRHQMNLPTVITTNLSLPDLQKKYDNRLYSRLFGDFKKFHFEGKDIRFSAEYRKLSR